MWGLITGSIAGLIDGLLILVAYLLYPIVVVIFGFFYIFYGSILYIFGPIVIALMPLAARTALPSPISKTSLSGMPGRSCMAALARCSQLFKWARLGRCSTRMIFSAGSGISKAPS